MNYHYRDHYPDADGDADEAMKALRKIVPLERGASSPKTKASLARQRRNLERVLLDADCYTFSWEVEDCIKKYAQNILKGRFPAGEELLLKLVDPQDDYGPLGIVQYAIKAVKGRWKEAEEIIAEDVEAWDKYLYFLRRTDKKALVAACKSRDVFAMWYAESVAKGEWKPGEKAILEGKDWCSYYYAKAMGRRWEPGEQKILKVKDPATCFDYAKNVIQGRWLEAERVIVKDKEFAMQYAVSIVKGRWEDGEDVIIKDPELCYLYAKDVIRGRLPDKMHNAMVMYSFSDPSNKWVKKYLGAKKYNPAA